jgi:hypothetical protein
MSNFDSAAFCDCSICIQQRKKRENFLMDKAYKKLGKEAKKIEKDTKMVLKQDKKRDKLVEKGKMAKKKGC